MAPNKIVPVGDGFWNIRGSFKVGGVLDVGTQASLVQRRNGRYLLLDACNIDEPTREWIAGQTNGGEAIDAVLHLHPFHTVYARKLHALFPQVKLYGTARHRRLAPELAWQPETTDDPSVQQMFADDLELSVPRGVDFIPTNENLHFSSVLAFHRASKTLHVDDTLCFAKMPAVLRWWKKDFLAFHPSLAKVLERQAGAAARFREWTKELLERSRSLENLCAAHTSVLLRGAEGPSIEARIEAAVRSIEPKLAAHERQFG
ncbi:MAG: hypothetical protein HOW73_23065 [Polyangiaceae bacterium]|nr:hypothetical protein [Polyangiaceae bacterium]